MKKYLFLDLDGVIANTWSVKQPTKDWICVEGCDEIAYPFFKPAVEQLNRVLLETDVDIILSSDWRVGYNLAQLDSIFKQNGVIKSPMAVTEQLMEYWLEHEEELGGRHERDIEIEKYVKDNDIRHFAIVDDMQINVHPNRFVRTRDSHGLSKNLADELIKILNG
jgi:hypothetical protein